MAKPLNIGMIGYGFMGRAHSNAYKQVGQFFPSQHESVLKAACARDADKIKAFADQWGYESIETDWRKLVERKDIDAIDICTPNNLHKEIALAAAAARQDDPVREAAGDERGRGRKMVEAVEKAGVAEHGVVQLPPHPGGHAREAAHRRRPARQDLPLPGQVPPGLDDQGRPAAGRPGPVAARRGRGRQRRVAATCSPTASTPPSG